MVNQAKEESKKDGKKYLSDVFSGIEDSLRLDLKREAVETTHDGTMGGNCEQHWRDLFRNHLPSRYGVAEAFVVDSLGHVSDQIDIVIYDTLYTPTLYGHDKIQYLPREAVYAAFEAKPVVSKKYLEYAGNKAESIQRLHCTSAPIVNAGRTFSARETFPILTGLVAQKADWVEGLKSDSFIDNLPTVELKHLDFVITANDGFYDGRHSLDEPVIATGDGSLMRVVFRLLQALQQLGTVPAIDWGIYEEVLK